MPKTLLPWMDPIWKVRESLSSSLAEGTTLLFIFTHKSDVSLAIAVEVMVTVTTTVIVVEVMIVVMTAETAMVVVEEEEIVPLPDSALQETVNTVSSLRTFLLVAAGNT